MSSLCGYPSSTVVQREGWHRNECDEGNSDQEMTVSAQIASRWFRSHESAPLQRNSYSYMNETLTSLRETLLGWSRTWGVPLERCHFTCSVISSVPYSLDMAPRDFYLFGGTVETENNEIFRRLCQHLSRRELLIRGIARNAHDIIRSLGGEDP